MEKENKKERDKAKREFNELVRRLAEFARKKDPRVLNWAKEQAALKLEKEAQEKESKLKQAAEVKAKQEAARLAQQAQLDSIDLSGMDLEELMSAKDLKRHKHLLGNDDEEDDEDDVVEEFYCPACKKVFKSDKQFKNHENSKKHKDMAAKLRKELMAEDEIADAEMAKTTKGKQTASAKATAAKKKGKFVPEDEEDIFVDDDDLFIQDLDMMRNVDDDLVHTVANETPEDDDQDSEEDETILADLSQYRLHEAADAKKTASQSDKAESTSKDADNEDDNAEDDGDDDDDMLNMMASAKASKSRFAFEDDDDEEEDDAEVDLAQLTPKKSFNFADFEASLPSSERSSPASTPAAPAAETVPEPEGKKKRRRAPKEKKEPTPVATPEPEPEYERGAKRGGKGKKNARATQHVEENSCRTCGSSFPSKSALHTHLKETKHAIAN